MTRLFSASIRVVALTSVVSLAGCATSALNQARQADMNHDYDLAVAAYTKARDANAPGCVLLAE